MVKQSKMFLNDFQRKQQPFILGLNLLENSQFIQFPQQYFIFQSLNINSNNQNFPAVIWLMHPDGSHRSSIDRHAALDLHWLQ